MITPVIPGASLKGMDNVVRSLNMVIRRLDNEVLPEVLVEALRPTLVLSNYYAPIDTGELRGSGYVEARRGSAEVGYGRHGQAPYAVFVHENPKLHHEPPTQAKFLQRAMDEDMGGILGRVVKGITARMRT